MNSPLLYKEVYHRDGILIVDKPSGLASQPTRKNEDNLFDRLMADYGYVALHHRLDRPASGLLLLCTDRRCNAAIAKGFQRKTIRRRYLAVVLGKPPVSGEWCAPIDGKVAKSVFQTQSQHAGFCVLSVGLHTGRTHQIRRHAQGAGHPILGDRRYGGAAGRLWSRLCLHANEIKFRHPLLHRDITITSDMPDDMATVITSRA